MGQGEGSAGGCSGPGKCLSPRCGFVSVAGKNFGGGCFSCWEEEQAEKPCSPASQRGRAGPVQGLGPSHAPCHPLPLPGSPWGRICDEELPRTSCSASLVYFVVGSLTSEQRIESRTGCDGDLRRPLCPGWELRLCCRPCQERGARGGYMDVGRGPSATNRSVSPLGKMLPAACGTALELEGGSWGGEKRPVAPHACFPGREARGCSCLPFPSGPAWQQAGSSADSHGEGISKATGSFLALLQDKTRCFPPALPSCNPSPRPHIKLGTASGGPPPRRRTAGRKTSPVLSAHPSPSAMKPARSSGGQQPVSPSPGPLPQRLCAPVPRLAWGRSEDHPSVQLLCPPGSLVPRFQVLVLDPVEVLQQLRVVDVGGWRPLGAGARSGAVPEGRGQRLRAGRGSRCPSQAAPKACPEEAELSTAW